MKTFILAMTFMSATSALAANELPCQNKAGDAAEAKLATKYTGCRLAVSPGDTGTGLLASGLEVVNLQYTCKEDADLMVTVTVRPNATGSCDVLSVDL